MREAGQVIGAIGLQSANGAGLLRSLAVMPSLHRQGRGAALVAAAERLAVRRGIDDMFLLTTEAAGFFALLDYLRVDRASATGGATDFTILVSVPSASGRLHAQEVAR